MNSKLCLQRLAAAFLLLPFAPAFAQENASCATGENLDGGRSYQVLLDTHDGQVVSFQVLEPSEINCAAIDNGAHPLMLHGPGYSGSRNTSGFANYRNDGYTVISWDPRGFGDTSGSVRVMDPEFEGQYYLQILDWAEQNLDYLAWRDEAGGTFVARPADASSVAGGVNLVVGAQGGSYGGGYQLMILTVDEKKRLDAIAPDITWHDLRNSLNPGDVVKTLWDLALTALGETSGHSSLGPVTDDGQDPFIKETLVRGSSFNEWPRQSLDWFHYRGLGYWCAANGLPAMAYPAYGEDAVPMADLTGSYNVPPRAEDGRPGLGEFLVGPADPATHLAGLDVLLTQGMVDTLFNYNEAWWNFQCLRAAGAEVSLYTHNGGHVLPGAQSPDKLPNNSASCSVNRKAWFDARLRPGAEPVELADTCFALESGGDTVTLAAADVLAPHPLGGGNTRFTRRDVAPATPVPNGPMGIANISGNLAVEAPLGEVLAGGILAGIPHVRLEVASLTGANELAQDCADPTLPTRTGCDSIIFVGLGKKSGSAPNFGLIDDQLTPLRGLGTHDVDLVGIAERLQPGDELALLFYATHPQFFSSVSRDATIPAVSVSGTVDLPLYVSNEDGHPEPDSAVQVLSGDPPPPPDSDGDGVPDAADECPDTPPGETVDEQGCSDSQKDSDGDGVTDDVDQCPDTPAGTQVDAVGCPIELQDVELAADPASGDVTDGPLTVSFTVTPMFGNPDGGTATYVYYFGDGSNSGETTDTTISHDYDKAGTFTARVAAVDENNNTAEDSVTITTTTTVTVNDPDEPPVQVVANLQMTLSGNVAPVTATFDASGSTAPDGAIYRFEFGDGEEQEGTSAFATHVYLLADTYTVTLTVRDPSDPANSDTAMATLTVGSGQQTTAQLVVSPSDVLVGEQVSFDASASIAGEGREITRYRFDFGDGSEPLTLTVEELAGDDPVAVHAYQSAGEYTPVLTVEDDADGSQQTSGKVIVRPRATDDPVTGEPGPGVDQPRRRSGSGAPGLLLLPLLLLAARRRHAAG